jgi:hypothetical protein
LVIILFLPVAAVTEPLPDPISAADRSEVKRERPQFMAKRTFGHRLGAFKARTRLSVKEVRIDFLKVPVILRLYQKEWLLGALRDGRRLGARPLEFSKSSTSRA